jgi:hypothetical protein
MASTHRRDEDVASGPSHAVAQNTLATSLDGASSLGLRRSSSLRLGKAAEGRNHGWMAERMPGSSGGLPEVEWEARPEERRMVLKTGAGKAA